MMNKKRTSRLGLMKYALLLPVTGLLILSANARTVVEMTGNTLQEWKQESLVQKSDQEEGRKLVTGKVVDETGKPLDGVSVLIRNQGTGTKTNEKGEFNIRVLERSALCFSYVGKRTETLLYDSLRSDLKIVMKKDNLQLDEIVVVSYSPKKKVKLVKDSTPVELFVCVEEMPKFPEGNVLNYLARHIKYPVRAAENGIQGKVFVTFIIDKEGKVKEAEVVRSVEASLDKEALRVVNMMPAWEPGKQRGKPVEVQYTLPIEFRLEVSEE